MTTTIGLTAIAAGILLAYYGAWKNMNPWHVFLQIVGLRTDPPSKIDK